MSTTESASPEILNYYPNPATDKFVFITTEKGKLNIENHLGQSLGLVSINDNETQISTDNLPSGIYYLIFTTEKILIRRKLVVQK